MATNPDPAAALAREVAEVIAADLIDLPLSALEEGGVSVLGRLELEERIRILLPHLRPLLAERDRCRAALEEARLMLFASADPFGGPSPTRAELCAALAKLTTALAPGAEEGGSDAEDKERLRWAWETAGDPDHPDREQAIICLESYVGRANGWFGGDRDEDDQ